MEEVKKKNKKGIIIGAIALIVLIAAFAAVYLLALNPTAGEKTITVEIVHADKTEKTLEITTDAKYLGKALEEKNLVQGTESSLGLFIKTADGETADDSKQQWWCLTQDGQAVNTGVDATPIKDGDKFELTLTTGY